MALTNNFIPNTSLVFTPMDYSKQLAQRQADDRNAVQGAAKFLGNVIDISKNNQIAEEMNKENPDYKKIDSLAASRIMTPDTSFTNWRWKQGQEQAAEEARKTREQALALHEADLERVKAEKDIQDAKRAQNTKYKIDAGLKKMAIDLNTTPEQLQSYINDAADLEAMGLTDDVGEDYMNRIWDMQQKLKGPLPSIKAGELANNFNVLDSQFDTVESQGGFGKNRDKYVEAVDKNWKDIQDFYAQFGQDVPLEVYKAYTAARIKHNKKKTSPKPGAPMKPRG